MTVKMPRTSCIWALMLALLTHVGWAATSSPDHTERPDPTQISREALLDVEVIIVSKRPEKRTEVAAAVYVITQEDLRRARTPTPQHSAWAAVSRAVRTPLRVEHDLAVMVALNMVG